MSERRVEILVFEGCPNLEATLERARTAVALANVLADIRLLRIETDAQAKRERFLGSPTVRVDGTDVEPTARQRIDFGLRRAASGCPKATVQTPAP
jgi:hypothetical protein